MVKCVDLDFDPHKLCLCGDELWMGGWDKGVFVYSTHLQKIRQITNKHLQYVHSVYKTDTDVIVCDSKTGLHLLNQQGDYLKHICAGKFSDVSVTNNTLLALEQEKHHIHVLNKSQSSWKIEKHLNMSGYSEGCNVDRFCASSNCIYVSCDKNHCVRVYSLTGNFLYKTGQWGKGKGQESGDFDNLLLSDVDSRGKLLLCDSHNNRLQVFDPQTKHWAQVQGTEDLWRPSCAGVGYKNLWVGTASRKLLKYEAQ